MTELKGELKEFVESALDGVKSGLIKDSYISSEIEFELAVVNTKSAEGKFKIFVAEGSGKYSRDEVSKIKFKIRIRDEDEPTIMGC